uniref:Water stress and hypersensitive response domain-containing protein n=2 Tax=Aegilops tauschii subsp. strangulata TaxID=200361 RepID=A0A453H4Z2_AEGTS
ELPHFNLRSTDQPTSIAQPCKLSERPTRQRTAHHQPASLPPMAKTQPRGPAAEPLLPPPPYLSPHSPADFHDADDSYVLLVPVRLRRRLRRGCGRGRVAAALAALALLALAFLLWPSDPGVSVARLRLAHVSVVARPAVALNVSAALKARVRNPNLFALDYSRLDVAIGYRGRPLGTVASGGGLVRARAVSYVDADLRLDGIRVVEDAIYLLEDLARGSIPFDAVVEVEGHLHFFFLSIPVKGRIACVVHVNPHDQTIVHQDCYPK